MQVVKFGQPIFLSTDQTEAELGVEVLLKGNLQIPITIKVVDEPLDDVAKGNTLYDQVGGEKAIEVAINIFYRKVLSDQHICRFFHYTDMVPQIIKQKAFLSYVLGGPTNYTGKDMRSAHALFVKMGLDDSHFDAVLGHLFSTFQELNIPVPLIDKAIAIAESTRNDVLGR